MFPASKKLTVGKKKQEVRDLQKALALINLNVDEVINWELADSKRLKELMPKFENAKIITFDCETSSLDMHDPLQFIIGIGFCYDIKMRKGCFVPLEHSELHISAKEYRARIELIKEILLNPVGKQGFNGGFDIAWTCNFLDLKIDGIKYEGDSMHEYHFIKASMRGNSLENLTLDYLPDMGGYDATVDVLKVKYGKKFAYFPLADIAPYCIGDCIATARLAEEHFDRHLKKEGSWKLYKEVVVPIIPIYTKMSMNGICLDQEYCARLEKAFAIKLPELKAICLAHRVVQRTNPKLDIDSPSKMAVFLYTTLGLPEQTVFKEKGGKKQWVISADKKAVDKLLELEEVSDEVKKFLRDFQGYSTLSTVNSRYASKWKTWISVDGLVHPGYNISGTSSGRLSQKNPNFQQLRRGKVQEDTEANKFLKKWPVRRMLVSRFPNGKLVECDYSQLELRVMGALSNDSVMVGTYRDGDHNGDLHATMAASKHDDFYEVSKAQQKQWRTSAKTINFKGAYSLNDDFLSAYKGLERYVEKTKKVAIAKGYAETIFKRRRRLPNLKLPVPNDTPTYKMTQKEKSNFYNRLGALRQAVNHTVQSPAHEIIEMALYKINKEFLRLNLKSVLILEVHDAFVADCVPEEVQIVGKILKTCMESITEDLDWLNGIPLVAKPEEGYNWAEKEAMVF